MYKTLLLLSTALFGSSAYSQSIGPHVSNQLVIKFKSETVIDKENCLTDRLFDNSVIDNLNSENNLQSIELTGNPREKDTYVLQFESISDLQDLIKHYEESGQLDFAEPNYIAYGGGQKGTNQTIPDDTHFSRQYGLHNDGSFILSSSTVDADVDMDLAWDIQQGDQSIIVATLDSGLKTDHPEVSSRLWNNAGETTNGADSDMNGYSDDIVGWDFVNSDNDPADDHGHGTNVTGIIGAQGDNSEGYAGVDWHCQLMTCKVLDQNNSGSFSWITDAMYYAVDNGAKVINMSLGGSSFSNNMEAAANYAYNNGVTIVACMMNENNSVTYYPAGYPNTIAVGATDANDVRANPFFWNANSGSNFGPHIDVVAPGEYIYGLSYSSNLNYNSYWGGTSQATPLVAGLSSLLLAQDPSRTPSEIKSIIISTAEDQVGDVLEDVAGFDVYYGHGRVNAYQALLLHNDINELENQIEFNVFPNPADEFVTISCAECNLTSAELTDYSGRLIQESTLDNVNASQLQFDLKTVPAGVYFIKMYINETYISSEKLIID